MQNKVLLLGAVLLAMIAAVLGSACYSCTFAKSGSSESGSGCKGPDVSESFSNTCNDKCVKDVYQSGSTTVIGRSCLSSCTEGKYTLTGYGEGKRYCCDPSDENKCNGSDGLRAGAVITTVAMVMTFKALF